MKHLLAAIVIAALWFAPNSQAFDLSHVTSLNGGGTLVIGDSHTWLAGAGRQYPEWDSDCRAGRASSEGLRVLTNLLRPRHHSVVFDIATNDYLDPMTYRRNLQRVRQLVGDRQLILVTAWRVDTPGATKGIDEIDRVVRHFARTHSRTVQVDFARKLRRDPDLIGPDGVHYTLRGYEDRTRTIRQAVNARP